MMDCLPVRLELRRVAARLAVVGYCPGSPTRNAIPAMPSGPPAMLWLIAASPKLTRRVELAVYLRRIRAAQLSWALRPWPDS